MDPHILMGLTESKGCWTKCVGSGAKIRLRAMCNCRVAFGLSKVAYGPMLPFTECRMRRLRIPEPAVRGVARQRSSHQCRLL